MTNKKISKEEFCKMFSPSSPNTKPSITGQLVFRDSGEVRNGRKIFMVCGVVSVPLDAQIKDEHQYTISAQGLNSVCIHSEGKDISSISIGIPIGELLTYDIWRV